MNKETKTVSLSLDSAQLAILEDALRDHNDMLYDEGCTDAEWDGAMAVEELRCIVASARESASVRSMKGKLL